MKNKTIFQIQRITAVLLLGFMTMHMVVVHYPVGHIDFSRVIERLQYPLWKAIDVAFLLTVLLHALLGTYDVLMDSEKLRPLKTVFAAVIALVGVAAFAYGAWTIISFQL